MFKLCDELPRFLIGILEKKNRSELGQWGKAGPEIETHDIVPKAGTESLYFRIFQLHLLCKVLLPLRESSFHLSKLDFESDPLFPQLLGFRALLVLQALPLVHLTFEVRVTPLKFGIGVLEFVLLVLDAIEP